ncbi:hypothetical protein [Candidatus Methylocalor cossyra]|uniref:Uncharacterized protein n=1 Tax=Candidatus Methylocalor cossyra TaxID=3108543 RepID=A0ABP1CBU7_9GAMM
MSHYHKLTSLAAAVTAALGSQGVHAHTTVAEPAIEGTSARFSLAIGHGCEINTGQVDANGRVITKKLPVIAQSVVFPTVNPIVTRPNPADPAKPIPMKLSDVLTDPLGFTGKITLIQDRNIFSVQNLILDGGGNTIGFYGLKGKLQPNLLGMVPFNFTAPAFVPSDPAHCAKRVVVKIAVADICKLTFPPKPGTANLWIPNTTAKFADSRIDGIGMPAILTINRKPDPATGQVKLDPACGEGYDVTVTPSNEDIDANLPIKGRWGR